MKRYAPERAIRRKGLAGKILSFAGLGVLFAGFFISLRLPELSNLILFTMVAGFFMSQTGVVLMNRWGRTPRIDQVIDRGLKGLGGEYTIFHYLLGANHVLSGPPGVVVLLPYLTEGRIHYQDGHWWQTRKRWGRERRKKLKQFQVDVDLEIRSLQKALRRFMDEDQLPPIRPVLVFLHPEATVDPGDSDLIAVHLKKLKSLVRKMPRQPGIPPQILDQIIANLRL